MHTLVQDEGSLVEGSFEVNEVNFITAVLCDAARRILQCLLLIEEA